MGVPGPDITVITSWECRSVVALTCLCFSPPFHGFSRIPTIRVVPPSTQVVQEARCCASSTSFCHNILNRRQGIWKDVNSHLHKDPDHHHYRVPCCQSLKVSVNFLNTNFSWQREVESIPQCTHGTLNSSILSDSVLAPHIGKVFPHWKQHVKSGRSECFSKYRDCT